MSGYGVSIGIDGTNIHGHTYLIFTTPDGVKIYGFYPNGDNKIHVQDESIYGVQEVGRSLEIAITREQYDSMKSFMDSYSADFSPTSIGGENCATAAMKTLQHGGISVPPILLVNPIPWLIPLLPQPYRDSPYAGINDVEYDIMGNVSGYYTAARNWVAPRDPLVLDLDGGGITTSAINPDAPLLFDQNGDGIKTASGWIASGEAIVVRDVNNNGTIDSGRELFGDSTLLTQGARAGQTAANGFEALADLDSNGDGKFNSADAAFASVKLWKDANQDGISQSSELFSFAALGVQSINVAGTASNVNLGGGNTQTLAGSFTRTNGQTGNAGTAELAASLLLAGNNFYREFPDDPVVSADAAVLPQMQGSGLVRDLREAMSLGTVQARVKLQASMLVFDPSSHRCHSVAANDVTWRVAA